MPGRTVTAVLDANISSYVAKMNQAAAATQQFASKASASVGKNKAGIEQLSRAAGLLGAGAAAGFGLAVKSAADFDSAMSSVAASGADAKANLGSLREAAIQAGAATKYSATEAAGGLESLLKAGVSAKDALGGGLSGALNLAAAGNLGVADSAEVAATAMTQFGLKGSQVPHVADLLAAGAGKAQGEVSDMAAALNQSGLVASQFGLSIEETTGSLAAFANAGLTGSDAGTSFKTMLQRLSNPSGQAAELMSRLGIAAYDAGGNFVGTANFAQQLKDKLGPLTQAQRNAALATIFGSDAIRAANVLYQQGGAGIDGWIKAVDQTGYAADVAATKANNLKGDLETLGGTLQTALITSGEGAQDPFRSLVQGATGAVDAFNNMSSSSKTALLGISGGIAAVSLSASGIGKIAVFANEAKAALGGLGVSARTAALATGVVGAGLVAGAVIFGNYAAKAYESKVRVDDLTQALQQSKGAIDGTIASTRAKTLEDQGALAAAQSLGISIADVTQASLGNSSAQNRVNAALGQYADGVENARKIARGYTSGAQSAGKATAAQADAADKVRDAIGSGNIELQKSIESYRRQADSAAAAGGAMGGLSDAYDVASEKLGQIGAGASGASGDVDDLTKSLFGLSSAALATSDAQIGFEQAIDAAADAAKKNGDNLKVGTAAGRENRSALNQLAAAGQKYVQSLQDQGKSAKTVEAATRDARNAFIDNATAMGLSTPKAKALADQYGLIPKKVRTEVDVDAKNSKADLEAVRAAIKGLPKNEQVQIEAALKKGGVDAAKAKLDEITAKKRQADIDSKANTSAADHDLNRVANAKRTAAINAQAKKDAANRDLNSTASKRRVATIVAAAAGVGAVNSALNNAARDRSSTIRVTTIRSVVKGNQALAASDKNIGATGGMITHEGFIHRGPLKRSRGGAVWGAGTGTSDDIPAMLSNGEFVIRAAAAKVIGLDELTRLNAQGYATGGLVGLAEGGLAAKTGKYQSADIYALIRALVTPVQDVARAAADVKREQAKLSKPKAALDKATRTYEKAKDRQEDLKDKVARLAKEAAATKGVTKADRELKKARLELTKANNAVSKSSRDKTQATQKYKDVAGPLEEATQRLTDAQKALADSARGVSLSFSDQYRSTSTDARDWIELMTTGATDLKKFNEQILKLRKTGLSETLVQQIVNLGQAAGGELANQIIAGGAGLVGALNSANQNLQTAADNLGYTASVAPVRKAGGGLVRGAGTGISDSIPARLSNGEWVVPAAAVPANRAALERMTYGRQVVSNTYARSAYTAPARSAVDLASVRGALAGATFWIQSPITGEHFRAFVQAEAGGVLDRESAKAVSAF